jgi:TRAP-type mannitol/chloroaromatic compound transport system substrate-binding protein
MSRRSFIKHAGIGGVLAAGTAPAFAQAAPEIKWRLASSFPKSLDTLWGVSPEIAARVSELTNKKFQITASAAGEIVPGLQVLDAVQNGTVEMGHTALYYYIGKDPAFTFGTALPFGLNYRQMNAWMYYGDGLKLLNEFLATYKCTAIPSGNTGVQMGGWYRKEIKTVADLKGLKMRIGGIAGRVLSRLGVVPQQLAGGDIYPALEKGTVDAAEWVGPYDDEKLGFNKVAKFYHYPGWWEGGPMLHLIINNDQLAKLPADYKAALEVACAEGNVKMMAKYDHLNPAALRRVVAGGAQLKPFPAPVMDACLVAAHQQWDEESAKSPAFKKLYESMKKYQAEQILWSRVAEGTYDNFLARTGGNPPKGAAAPKAAPAAPAKK